MVGVPSWQTIPQVVEAAERTLSAEVWDYSRGGAETETTLRRNRVALDALAFRPRVLRDVSVRTTATTFLGIPLDLPVLLGPVGSIGLFDPDGALACARAAQEAGTGAFVGSLATPSLEDVSGGAEAPLFFQLYITGERPQMQSLVARAVAAGYRGICLTVDSAAYGRRERDIVNGFRPLDRAKPNVPAARAEADGRSSADFRASVTWADVDWLREISSVPVMVKGIMCAQDAALAVERGVDVVYVSNHGGRQLDHGSATIDVLPEVVDAVAGRAAVLVDGGFTRGTDVLKAVALGADGVVLGKLMVWALAAGGTRALVRVLELLRLEMDIAMANIGVTSVAELSPEHVRPARPA
jgi:isopentenyl diphosphate isomerase/L-lactate dehydrogenase-like FMN-dependent dehydrogenase